MKLYEVNQAIADIFEQMQFIRSKGHHQSATGIADYPESFITGWVLKYWNAIVNNINAGAVQQS